MRIQCRCKRPNRLLIFLTISGARIHSISQGRWQMGRGYDSPPAVKKKHPNNIGMQRVKRYLCTKQIQCKTSWQSSKRQSKTKGVKLWVIDKPEQKGTSIKGVHFLRGDEGLGKADTSCYRY